MNDIEINDKRQSMDFKGETFSKFQKSRVKTELINSLVSSKVEPACYWSAELICAGQFGDLWDIIILFISRYIHLGNPKLPIYISLRFKNFKDILSNGYTDNELRLRNNPKIRQLFSEIICVLCHSRKKHSFEPIKIKKEDEFNMSHMASRLKAPSITYGNSVFRKDDPKELYIAINEFSYHVSSESKNVVSACYWLEWLLEFESICKQKKDHCVCENRHFAPVQTKFQNDTIWIVWEVILNEGKNKKIPIINKILNALLEMFSIKYTSGVKKRRKFIIYFAIALLTEPVDLHIDMIQNKEEIDTIVKKIGIVYKEIKKNEITPETDYLFNGLNEKSSFDKTIERLDKMNELLVPSNSQ
jgi:hypothetical protein